ncbi:MAG: hypothetical protein JSS82_08080 [Bacteroidetes bacterium]|nr:hypothetical protein [Bacteroidota bacterium]
MDATNRTLTITIQGEQVKIEGYKSGKLDLFKVNLTKPFYVTKIKGADGYYVWTSVPQGEQELAETIGELIDKALGSNGKSSEQQSLF